jgi:hypothetical protein
MEDLHIDILIVRILPFVGDYQFRYVAGVNRKFHEAYTFAFPKKRSHYNANTIEHAKICHEDMKEKYHTSHQKKLCKKAAELGQLDVLQYLFSNGSVWDNRCCSTAALNGHLDVLKWLHENGCPWDSGTCANAALSGHLNVLQWARENGCPWDESTCACAASSGHFDVLEWAHNNDCPWDEKTSAFAARDGHGQILEWVYENGCPMGYWICPCAHVLL